MDRRISKTKKAIRAALLTLINEKPKAEITITELADKADVDRRIFYHHYSAVIDIFIEIEKEIFDNLSQRIKDIQSYTISRIITEIDTVVLENYRYFQCLENIQNYSVIFRNGSNKLKKLFKELFYENSKLKLKEFKICTDFLIDGILGAYRNWLTDKNRCSLSEFSSSLEKAVTNGWNKITGNQDCD